MTWKIEFDKPAEKELLKLDKQIQLRIKNFLLKKLLKRSNPRQLGTPLEGHLKGLWKYRVGDYRLICDIGDDTLIILVISVGHRKNIYH